MTTARTTPHFRALALGAWLAASLGAAAFVYENPYEMSAEGDFNGDGFLDLVVVDKATGVYRIGYQQAGGVFQWSHARGSGLEGLTGFSVGRLASTAYDSLAFASPAGNRVNILDASAPASAALPLAVFGPGIGPASVLAVNVGGAGDTPHHDLNVISIQNGLNPYYQTLFRNDGSTNRVAISHAAVGGAPGGANRVVLKTGSNDCMGFFMRSPGTEVFRVYDFASGATVQTLSITPASGGGSNQFIHGWFNPTNPLVQVLFYRPGQSNFHSCQLSGPSSGIYSPAAPLTFPLGRVISQMFAVAAGATNKLLVLFGDGDSATLYHFNGLNAPVPVQTYAADAGEHFTGGAVLGGHFSLLSGAVGSHSSTRFKVWNGATLALVASGDLPPIAGLSGKANVLLFRYEPFVSSSPVLLRLLKGGDWSSALTFAGGAPPPLTVNVERFVDSAHGLDDPVPTAVGTAPPLSTSGLVNQYTNFISLFSYLAPVGDQVSEVKVSPDAGAYRTAVNLVFSASDPTHLIYFRFGAEGAWRQYTNQPLPLFSNATVHYYGQPPAGTAKSSIKSAAYTFPVTPGAMDSDGDGVPDYAEVAKGLDPVESGSDADGDGFTDLEELIANTNPADASDHPPATASRLELKAAFDWALTPRPRDGVFHTPRLVSNGAPVRAYSLQGSLHAATFATNIGVAGVIDPAARLSNIVIETQQRLAAAGTDLHYDIQTPAADARIGREMIRLVSLPAVQAVSVPYTYGGGNITNEAAAWIAAAAAAYASTPREIVKGEMTANETLAALLFEKKVAEIFQARGSNWWSNMTLFPFRASDAGRTNPSQAALLSLESRASGALPAWQIKSVYAAISNLTLNSTLGAILNLRAVVAEIYDICSARNNTNPATYASPVDEVRHFLWRGTLDSNYLAVSANAGLFASASAGANTILSSVQPRPVTNLTLVVRADSFSGYCRTFDIQGTAAAVNLFDAEAAPFLFPESFELLPGSRIEVVGFPDVSYSVCPGQDLEVISIGLAHVPVASDLDTDGNLLLDTWERLFLEGLGSNPFGNADGDAYSNLQEMFEGSDPSDAMNIPATAPVAFAAPTLEFIPDGALVRLRFDWPAAYIGKVRLNVLATPVLGTPFSDLGAGAPASVGPNRWEVTAPSPPASSYFYLVSLSLAPLAP